jgi:4-hydroxybenzoyl-CoA thioesterase
MLNDTIEDWFDILELPFHEMHSANMGVPMANIECNFKKPSFLGDILKKELTVVKLGKSSCTLKIEFIGKNDNSLRVTFSCTIVSIDLSKKSSNLWSDKLKNKMNKYVENK